MLESAHSNLLIAWLIVSVAAMAVEAGAVALLAYSLSGAAETFTRSTETTPSVSSTLLTYCPVTAVSVKSCE